MSLNIQYVEIFRSSTCLLLVLGCNTLSAVSYMVRITATPYIFLATRVVAYAEIIVYTSVLLALPIRMIWLKLRQKMFGDSVDGDSGADEKKIQ